MILDVGHVVIEKSLHSGFHHAEPGLNSIHVAVRPFEEIQNGLKPASSLPPEYNKTDDEAYVSGYGYSSFQRHCAEEIGHGRTQKKRGEPKSTPHSTGFLRLGAQTELSQRSRVVCAGDAERHAYDQTKRHVCAEVDVAQQIFSGLR